jgi:hypothetical protein
MQPDSLRLLWSTFKTSQAGFYNINKEEADNGNSRLWDKASLVNPQGRSSRFFGNINKEEADNGNSRLIWNMKKTRKKTWRKRLWIDEVIVIWWSAFEELLNIVVIFCFCFYFYSIDDHWWWTDKSVWNIW